MASEEHRSCATVLRLRIKRFRGIQYLDWQPADGINVIVGPADSAKSTVLEALALVMSPAPTNPLSEFDYFARDTATTFSIEVVVGIGDGSVLGDGFPLPPMRGWRDRELTDLPDEEGAEAVLVCRLVGSADCEAVYDVVGAGDEVHYALSRALRQRLGLVRLGVGDRGDRDLRLVQGGALDRFLDARALRRTVAKTVSRTPIHEQLDDAPAKALQEIEKHFKESQLPVPVRLGLVGAPGVSLAASVGLTIGVDDESALPLASWGNGTRRLAALEIAGLGMTEHAIAVFDEPETGLEPYRQRAFIGEIGGDGKRQVFITTHAPAVLSASLSAGATVWRMRSESAVTASETPRADDPNVLDSERSAECESHCLLALHGDEAATLAINQSEVLVARMPVVCEGVTEVGFATALFRSRWGGGFQRRGLFCLDAGGHYKAVEVCRQLVDMGFSVAAIVDDEGRRQGVWASLESRAIVLRWRDGQCLEKAVFGALPDKLLQEIPRWAEAVLGRSAKHQIAEIRRELNVDKDVAKDIKQLFEAVGRERFLSAVSSAACPRPEGNSKPRGWFKSYEGGRLLAEKVLSLGSTPDIVTEISTFLDRIDSTAAS